MIFKATQIAFLLITCASLALATDSQANPCELNIKIFDINSFDTLNTVNIKFTEFNNKQIHKATKASEYLVFNNLNSGIYQIELNKKGFKRKIKKFSIDCSFADNSNKLFENIYLWKGSSKDITRLDTTKFSTAFEVSASGKNPTGVAFEATEKVVNGHVVNGKVVNLVKPTYPSAAKAVRASGAVNVQVTIDEDGNVIKADAVDGHALLQGAAIKAVRQSKFSPTLLSGNPVKVTGIIVFNFSAQ